MWGCRELSLCFSPWDAGTGGTRHHPALQQRMLKAGGPHGPTLERFVLVTDPTGRTASLCKFFFLMDQLVPVLALQHWRQSGG